MSKSEKIMHEIKFRLNLCEYKALIIFKQNNYDSKTNNNARNALDILKVLNPKEYANYLNPEYCIKRIKELENTIYGCEV